MRTVLAIISVTALLTTAGCISPKIKLFTDETDPLKEYTLDGQGTDKVLLIAVRGVLSEGSKQRGLRSRSGVVEELVAQLRLAEKDDHIRALIVKIDSPGGSITASDLLYHELSGFKERKKVPVVAALMGVAASGGYYSALPADWIVAHPTSITGSVGVIFVRPKVAGLFDKLGLAMEVNKSGKNKDMGSPFRSSTEEEQAILQGLIDELAQRFLTLVARHRKLDQQALANVATARIYLAEEAQRLRLIDQIGYLQDAIAKAKQLAVVGDRAKVVAYRRSEYPNDNIYNWSASSPNPGDWKLFDLQILEQLAPMHPGFYYLWLPGSEGL